MPQHERKREQTAYFLEGRFEEAVVHVQEERVQRRNMPHRERLHVIRIQVI